MDIITAYEEFLSYILFEKRLSKNTCIEYGRDIRNFADFAKESKVLFISQISKQLVINFRVSLTNKKLTCRTICRNISVLREFIKFLRIRYDFDDFEISAPKFECTLPEICSPQLIKKIMRFLQKNKNVVSNKDILLFQLFYSTGIRASEIVNLKVSDIYLGSRLILVNGKGGKQRLVPYPITIQENLTGYLKDLQSDFLFPFSRFKAWYVIKKIGKCIGIKLYPHKLRHSIATHLLENGANLIVIKKLLGHESINTTATYTSLNTKLLRKNYNKFHPRAK